MDLAASGPLWLREMGRRLRRTASTNGLIRRSHPKKSSFAGIGAEV